MRTAIPTVARQTALAAAFRADLPESEGVLDAAWAAAEATHTLELLRAHRRSLLSVPLVGSPAPDRNVPAGDVKAGAAEDTDLDPAIREASLTLFSAACLRHRTALARLETYERRALSRRRRAIQALAYYTITAEAPQRAPRE